MWLHNAKTGATVVVVHPDTIARCLGDGWVEVPGPTIRVESAPVQPPIPPEVAAEMERQRFAAIHERNDSAREAFGVQPRMRKGRR